MKKKQRKKSLRVPMMAVGNYSMQCLLPRQLGINNNPFRYACCIHGLAQVTGISVAYLRKRDVDAVFTVRKNPFSFKLTPELDNGILSSIEGLLPLGEEDTDRAYSTPCEVDDVVQAAYKLGYRYVHIEY